MQCPLVHYHPLCTTCRTLIPEFCIPNDPSAEQKSIDFSTLSRAVKMPAPSCPCLQGYRLQITLKTRKMWTSWRNEQFVQAAEERRERLQARERLRQETWDRWMRTMNTGITTQLSTPTSPTDRSLTTPHTHKPPKAITCTKPPCRLEGLMETPSTGD